MHAVHELFRIADGIMAVDQGRDIDHQQEQKTAKDQFTCGSGKDIFSLIRCDERYARTCRRMDAGCT
ncbi:MAG: hypothetical protein IPM91_20285 [Bacteroidetes bacterium]|nr:hypothetical protein [Bacteroidota bacterium]